MSTENIKRLKEEVKSAEELLVSKRKEIIKSKLAYLQDNPDTEEAHLTSEEWIILKEHLIERSDATSVKMQHTQIIDYNGYNENYYNTILRVGKKYISIYDSAVWGEKGYGFSVKDTLSADYKEYFDEYYKKEIKEVTLNGIVFKKDVDTRPIIEGKNELTKPLEIEKLFEEKTASLNDSVKNEDANHEKTKTQQLTAEDRYANIIIEKLRIIEETDNIEEIPSPLFTLDETKRIREVLKGKEDCFKNICKDEDVIQYDGWVTGSETHTTNIFEIGNKVVELGDFDGRSWSFVKTHEQYLKDYQRELTDLPQRKITIEEIQEAFVEYNSKIENARKDFEQFIKDSVPKEAGQIRPWVICKDGREYSIQASKAHYCSPREHGLEDYEEFEVKYKENTEEPELEKYKGEEPVCCFVPKDVIIKVISEHGGLDKELMQQRLEEQKKIYAQEDEEYEKWIKEESNGDPLVEQFLRNAKFQEVLRYVKRKKDLIKKNEQAKDLLNEYEQQKGKDGQEQGDEE